MQAARDRKEQATRPARKRHPPPCHPPPPGPCNPIPGSVAHRSRQAVYQNPRYGYVFLTTSPRGETALSSVEVGLRGVSLGDSSRQTDGSETCFCAALCVTSRHRDLTLVLPGCPNIRASGPAWPLTCSSWGWSRGFRHSSRASWRAGWRGKPYRRTGTSEPA